MSKQPEISRLIAKAFQEAEWQLLCSHKEFAEAVRKAKTIDDAHHLMMAGEKILNPPPQVNCKPPPANVKFKRLKVDSNTTKVRIQGIYCHVINARSFNPLHQR